MDLHVSTSTFISLGISVLLGIALFIGLFIFMKKKFAAKTLPFIVGCGTFFIFALVLEGICNSLLFASPLGNKIMANALAFSLLGGFQAGLFEETGRFVAFKTILKKSKEDDSTALMYGAGHGGIEIILVWVVTMITNIVFAVLINLGQTSAITASLPADQLPAMQAQFSSIAITSPFTYPFGLVERMIAATSHIALSVLVWIASKEKKNLWLYPLAIFIHMLEDGILAFIVQSKLLDSTKIGGIAAIELILLAIVAIIVLITVNLAKKYGLRFSKKDN